MSRGQIQRVETSLRATTLTMAYSRTGTGLSLSTVWHAAVPSLSAAGWCQVPGELVPPDLCYALAPRPSADPRTLPSRQRRTPLPWPPGRTRCAAPRRGMVTARVRDPGALTIFGELHTLKISIAEVADRDRNPIFFYDLHTCRAAAGARRAAQRAALQIAAQVGPQPAAQRVGPQPAAQSGRAPVGPQPAAQCTSRRAASLSLRRSG